MRSIGALEEIAAFKGDSGLSLGAQRRIRTTENNLLPFEGRKLNCEKG
jgi:hypothetical protein